MLPDGSLPFWIYQLFIQVLYHLQMISSIPSSSSIMKTFSNVVPAILSQGSCMPVCMHSHICIFKIYIETQKGAQNTGDTSQLYISHFRNHFMWTVLIRRMRTGCSGNLHLCLGWQAPFQGQAANGMISTQSQLCHITMTLSRAQCLWIQEESSSHLLKAAQLMLQHRIFPGSRKTILMWFLSGKGTSLPQQTAL